MIFQKILAILLVTLTIPAIVFDGDATATIFALLVAVPTFFSKKKVF